MHARHLISLNKIKKKIKELMKQSKAIIRIISRTTEGEGEGGIW